MIRRIEALNYRCLRHVAIPLGRRQVLVGPNGSGKSALISAFTFLGDLVREGPVAAVAGQARGLRDLVWRRPAEDPGFELAVELELPEAVRDRLPAEKGYRTYRYEVALGAGERGAGIRVERGILSQLMESADAVQDFLFPELPEPPPSILAPARAGARTVLSKSLGGMDRFYVERNPARGWVTDIALGPQRSALGGLPESPDRLPASTFARRTLGSDVTRLQPDVSEMKRPCSPDLPDEALLATGSNLAWVVRRVRGEHREAFDEWLGLLRGALPGLTDIRAARRKADRHGYLMLRYGTGLELPSWLVSDGTLRLLALTLPAFLPDSRGVFLVETPECDLHTDGLDALHASLFSMPGAQVIATTCSPALQQLFGPDEVLFCEQREDGAARIARIPQGEEK